MPRRSAGRSDARLPRRQPRCPPVLAEAQAPGARQPTTLQQGEGKEMQPGSRNRTVGRSPGSAESAARVKPRAPFLGTDGSAEERSRTPKLPPHSARGALPHRRAPAQAALHPVRTAPSYARSCGERFYIPFGITLTCAPTANPIPAPTAKPVELQRTHQPRDRCRCARRNGQRQDKIPGNPTVSALRSAELGQAPPGSVRSISRCFTQREDERRSIAASNAASGFLPQPSHPR